MNDSDESEILETWAQSILITTDEYVLKYIIKESEYNGHEMETNKNA